MSQWDYIFVDERWYAWHPVLTEEGKWVWFDYVKRTTDERELVYQGLTVTVTYNLIEEVK